MSIIQSTWFLPVAIIGSIASVFGMVQNYRIKGSLTSMEALTIGSFVGIGIVFTVLWASTFYEKIGCRVERYLEGRELSS